MNKPFIIAEMSGNHNKSLDRALQIVDAVAKTGADALKLQTYTADSMTIDCDSPDFIIEDKDSLWAGEKLYDLYIKASTPYEWHKPIFEKCKEVGILCFSTPFDIASVNFLETLNSPIYKIASFENGDMPLLKRIAQTKKPVIMSLGMITLDEIHEAVENLYSHGCTNLTLLKCTSNYPATIEDANLLTIQDLKKKFPQCIIGLSDHTIGLASCISSIALGAEVIEKHFTLSRAEGGVDSAFSIEPKEMTQLVEECRNAYKALGKITYTIGENEQKSMKFRRSLYIVQNIKKGEKFTPENLRCIRPGFGLHPREYEKTIGKTAVQDIVRGTPLTTELIQY